MKKSFILILALILGISTVFAQSAEIQNIYLQDFTVTDNVSSNITPSVSNSFSAYVSDEALHMKTDSLCYFRATALFGNITEANSKENSRGLIYYNKGFFTGYKLDEPQDIVHTDKKTYTVNYKVNTGGSNALILDEVDGIAAIGFHTFNNQDRKDKPVNTPDVKFNVTPGLFSATDNTVAFKFTVYAEQKGAPLNMTYVKPNGSQTTRALFTFGEDEVGKWVTKEVTLSDIDLTALISQDSGANLQQYTFRINTTLGNDIYLHSIEIVKPDRNVSTSADSNIYKVKVNETSLYGDVELYYDLVFPSGFICTEDVCGDVCVAQTNYNSGKNYMTVNLLNQDELKIATVVYILDGETGTVGFEYTDNDGNIAFEPVYEGNLYDRNLRYSVTYNMTDATNSFAIYEGEDIVASLAEPLGIKNKEYGANTFAQFYSIEQNQSSNALYTVIDNIGINFWENINYKRLVEDINSIELPSLVSGDFTLPSSGAVNGSSIFWESADSSMIAVFGSDAKVTQDAEDNVRVVLTATISDGIFTVSGNFEVTVKALKGEFADRFPVEESSDGENIVATTHLKNAGRSGAKKIRFMAVSYKGGKLLDRAACEKDVADEYGALDFEVTVKKGDSIKYYLWDENNVPVANNAPHIYNTKFENKVLGAVVKWEKAYDDFNAVETYMIERNDGKVFVTEGEDCGDDMLKFFDSDAVENTTYTYTLTAVDTNGKTSESVSGRAKKVNMPYSMYLTPHFSADGTHDGGNHISFVYRADPERAAYTENSVYEGEQCMFIPSGKYAAFVTDLSDVTENIVVRFTYASAEETKLKFMYNGKKPDGSFAEVSESVKTYPATNGWQTVDFKLDKEFRAGNTFTGGLFGLGASSPVGVYLKKVEFVRLKDYE